MVLLGTGRFLMSEVHLYTTLKSPPASNPAFVIHSTFDGTDKATLVTTPLDYHPIPCTLHPSPCTLRHATYTLHTPPQERISHFDLASTASPLESQMHLGKHEECARSNHTWLLQRRWVYREAPRGRR